MSCSNCKQLIENLESRISELEKTLNELNSQNEKFDNSTQTDSKITDEKITYKDEKVETSLADMIKDISDECMENCGYVYDQRTQLYFHKESGFYYDSTTQLFYNPTNGYYYSYNTESNMYEYHSKENMDDLEVYNRELIWMKGLQHKRPENTLNEDDAACIRLINEKTGDLHIVTYSGGLLSTKTELSPLILLIDTSDGECSVQIDYNHESSKYQIYLEDCQGIECLINSEILDKDVKELSHFDRLQFGSTQFYIHIHEDHGTCDRCEPGCIDIKDSNQAVDSISDKTQPDFIGPVLPGGFSRNNRKLVKNLKKKYGLLNPTRLSSTSKSYIDRAALRRTKEKAEKESLKYQESGKKLSTALTMMHKMGWKYGDSLGKDYKTKGIIEPIFSKIRINNRAGLGSELALSVSEYDEKLMKKMKMVSKMKSRYEANSQT